MAWGRFAPRRPRHPLVRVCVGLLGAALLALVVVFGLFVGVAMLALTAGWKLSRMLGATSRPRAVHADADTDAAIDGEYAVVRKPRTPLPHP